MNYVKRTYNEVKGTFDFTLTYKNIFTTYEMLGVNTKGLWLWLNFGAKPLGFFEWEWIKEILVSQKDEAVYIVMYDMQSIIDNVILGAKWYFKDLYVCKQSNGDLAIGLAMNYDISRILGYIVDQELAKVISIE